MGRSEELFERAKKVIPGGVNSPVRAFGSVGLTPRFISRADRQKIYDTDGRAYTDYVGSWGPMILGHNHPVVREAVERAVRDGLSFGAATATSGFRSRQSRIGASHPSGVSTSEFSSR